MSRNPIASALIVDDDRRDERLLRAVRIDAADLGTRAQLRCRSAAVLPLTIPFSGSSGSSALFSTDRNMGTPAECGICAQIAVDLWVRVAIMAPRA
jgi:hypothetical protein